MSVLLLILGLLFFVGLVVLHEFGHFIVARRNGVEVEEFGIGFPPRAKLLKKKGGTEYTLNWLPLGGFVKLKGEHDADHAHGAFGAASLLAKVKIMTAGVAMNLIAAFVLFTVVALVGMPQLVEDQFTVKRDTKVIRQELLAGYIEPDSPAKKGGLESRDRLVALGISGDEQPVGEPDDFPDLTKAYAGQSVSVVYERDGQRKNTMVQLRSKQEVEASKQTDSPKGYLGIAPSEFVMQRSTWSAPIVAAGLIKQFSVLTVSGLGSAISSLADGNTQKATEQVAGPVGIFVVLRDGSLLGYQFVLFIIAIISLTLAVMNILPIPALDGGRLFVTLLFRAIRRPLTQRTEDLIHGTGFGLLMVLFVLITVVDVKRFF